MRYCLLIGLALCLHSCLATYHQQNSRFHKLLAQEQFAEADACLAKDKRAEQRKTKLLYYLNRGLVTHLMGKYEESNRFFEQAYTTHQDFYTKYLDKALALMLNPTFAEYQGEDHEVLLLHYYKALNFLQLGQYETALVECRRLNIKLNLLSDKYGDANKYRRDAFIHTLMGLVYQANQDYNNAFIAYRNAVEIYQTDYKQLFGLEVPLQLKKDLIYTAYQTGLHDQVARYQKMFSLQYDPAQEPTGYSDALFLWNNGLGPVKEEWALNFAIIPQRGGMVLFYNHELGFAFPFPLPRQDHQKQSLANLKLIRVVFPRYRERPLLYHQGAILTAEGTHYPFEILEDTNAISFQVLRQRMMLEFSTSLLRVALKQLTQHQLSQQNEVLGAVLGGVNFVTEKADTRNWQTIPHSISYARVRLPAGTHTLRFQATARKHPRSQERSFSLTLSPGKTVFRIINAPFSIPNL